MAWPNTPTAKPAYAVPDGSTGLRAMVTLTEGSGSPVDCVTKLQAVRALGFYAMGTSRSPEWVSGLGGDYALRFRNNSPTLIWDGAGIQANWSASIKGFWAVFKHDYPRYSKQYVGSSAETSRLIPIWGVGYYTSSFVSTFTGLALDTVTHRACFFKSYSQYSSATGAGRLTAPMILDPGSWYLMYCEMDQTTASPYSMKWWLYDYTRGKMDDYSGQGGRYETTGAFNTITTAHLNCAVLNPYATPYHPRYDFAAGGIREGGTPMDDTAFATLAADPYAAARGSFSAGALAWPTYTRIEQWDSDDTKIVMSMPYTLGVQSPSLEWHLGTTAGFTPDSSTLLSNGAGVSGATSRTLTYAPSTLDPGRVYYFKARATSGTTITSYDGYGICDRAAPVKIGRIGDSLTDGSHENYPLNVDCAWPYLSFGVKVEDNNHGYSGLTTGLFIPASTTGNRTGQTGTWTLGYITSALPSGGTFSLEGTLPTGTRWTAASIAYNASTATVKSAIEAALQAIGTDTDGYNWSAYALTSVASSGGGLEAGAVYTVTSSGSRDLGDIRSNGASLTGTGPTVWASKPVPVALMTNLCLPASTANNAMAQAIADFQANGVTHVRYAMGTNDSTNSFAVAAVKANIQAAAETLVANGFKVLLDTSCWFWSAPPDATLQARATFAAGYNDALAEIAATNPTNIRVIAPDYHRIWVNSWLDTRMGTTRPDGVHQNANQQRILWAAVTARTLGLIYPASSGGASSESRINLGIGIGIGF